MRSEHDDQRMAGPNLPPPFSASTVEIVCRALGEAVRGHQIANLLAVPKLSEDASEARNAKWKRLFNAVAVAQNRQRDGRPLLRLSARSCSRCGSSRQRSSRRIAFP